MEDLIRKINVALSVKLKLCLITRGLPGRGKSRLARNIEEQIRDSGVTIAAADDFLLDNQGNYCWRAEWLSIAHSSCVDKLTAAMQDPNISVVVQHNTNCKAWESEQLREQAEKMNYVVIYIEPDYAWSLQENLPMELQHALKSIHSVPAEKIPEMLLNKEEIVPRYVGYWIPTSYLLECFEQAGMVQNDVLEFLLSCQPKQTAASASKTTDQSNATPLLPTMLHVTTDYLGFDTSILSSENHETLRKDQLSYYQLSIVALYADERGVGAYVTGPGGVTTWIEPDVDDEESTIPSTLVVGSPRSTGSYLNSGSGKEDTSIESLHIGGSGGGIDGDKKRPKKRPKENKLVDPVPRFQMYTKALRDAAGKKPVAPHITLITHPGSEAYQVGEAAAEFEQLFLNRIAPKPAVDEVTTKNHPDGINQSDHDQDGDSAMAKKISSMSLTDNKKKKDGFPRSEFLSSFPKKLFFRAVVFEKPVEVTAIYAASYAKPEVEGIGK